jgi:hypothetical protein
MKYKIAFALSLAVIALTACQGKGLKYDGVYVSTVSRGVNSYDTQYLRIYPDGKVTTTSTLLPFSPPTTASTVGRQYDAPYQDIGNYQASENKVNFKLGKAEYSGKLIVDGSLSISIDGNAMRRVYTFVPVSEEERKTMRPLESH